MKQKIEIEEKEPRYYKPPLARSFLHRMRKLFSDFSDVGTAYDNNPVKFIERAVLNLIDEEEQKQIAKIAALRGGES